MENSTVVIVYPAIQSFPWYRPVRELGGIMVPGDVVDVRQQDSCASRGEVATETTIQDQL